MDTNGPCPLSLGSTDLTFRGWNVLSLILYHLRAHGPYPYPLSSFEMPPKRIPREYRGNSCHRCHKQKVKCSKGSICLSAHIFAPQTDKVMTEKPCRNCALAKLPCTYAIPDRKVIVRESYLKRLQSAAIDHEEIATATDRPHLDHRGNVRLETEKPEGSRGLARVSSRFVDPLVENSTAELFVSKLRDIQKSQDLLGPPATDQSEGSASSGDRANQGPSKPPPYEYIALSFDTLCMQVPCCPALF